MPKKKTSEDNFSSDTISISEMAEMVGIYYNEIKSIAENLEKPDSMIPKSDSINLLNSLVDYSKVGNELTATFTKKVETFAKVKSAELNDIETGPF